MSKKVFLWKMAFSFKNSRRLTSVSGSRTAVWARICKRLRSPGIDCRTGPPGRESIPRHLTGFLNRALNAHPYADPQHCSSGRYANSPGPTSTLGVAWRTGTSFTPYPLPPTKQRREGAVAYLWYLLYVYFGKGGGGQREGRGVLVHKTGRKYQHDWLYLLSMNSFKHQ